MAVVYRDPWVQLQQELEHMLDAAFRASPGPSGGLYPPVNVFDQGEAFVVKAELPGVNPEQVEVNVEEDTLTLRGERSFSEPNGDAAFHRRERGAGQFRRVVRLPGRTAGDEATAQYRDGVLTITIPKAKETRPRRVQIKAA